MTKLLQNWKAAEPVRLYLYGALVPVVAGLVVLGVIDGMAAGYVLAVAAAVLGVAGIESARASVVSPLTLAMPENATGAVVNAAIDSVPADVLTRALIADAARRHRSRA